MQLERVMALKGDCELLLSDEDSWLHQLANNDAEEAQVKEACDRACKEWAFRRWLGGQFKERAEYYWEREMTGQIAHDDPLDIERFYIYLLAHASFAPQLKFPELHEAMARTRGILNRTFKCRRKALQETQPNKKD